LNRRKDAPLAAFGPVSDSAVGPTPDDTGIESPDRLPRCGVQRNHVVVGRNGKENAAGNERLGLGFARPLARIIRPCDLKLGDVRAVYLSETRISNSVRASAIAWPFGMAFGLRRRPRGLCRDARPRKQEQ